MLKNPAQCGNSSFSITREEGEVAVELVGCTQWPKPELPGYLTRHRSPSIKVPELVSIVGYKCASICVGCSKFTPHKTDSEVRVFLP